MLRILVDFVAETETLDQLLAGLIVEQWRSPTPAAGWDVRDSVAHLAMSNEIARESALTDKTDVMEQLQAAGSVEALERHHLERGRASSGAEVHDWWRASNEALVSALRGKDAKDRLPWGPNLMSVMSFTTARLMETWAHGLDCFAAVDVQPLDTERLHHVADLGLRTLPYAFTILGLPAPGPVRLELTAPGGEVWRLGPDDAPSCVTGSAGDWCRVAVHRDRDGERARLVGSGPDGAAVISNAQAYLSA